MWIRRQVFDGLNEERITAAEEARVLRDQNTTLKITMEWALQRVQHIEIERALLLKQYMGIAVQVPQFVKPEVPQEDQLVGAAVFNDVGDDEAKRRGLLWNDVGELTQ